MRSRKELTDVRARGYRCSNRAGKGRILTEFCESTGYNRAYAAMLLRAYRRVHTVGGSGSAVHLIPVKSPSSRRGRPCLYDAQVRRVVENLWVRFGYLCGRRLAPVIRDCLGSIRRDRFLRPSARVSRALATISPATIDRMLKPAREKLRIKGISHTRSSPALRQVIEVRTFGEFSEVAPGHCQIDTVGHDGGVASGDYAFSVVISDVCTAWTERRAVPNRAARWIRQALDEMRLAVPFAVRHLHPDCGSEFINMNILRYCGDYGITLTRSRAGKKNDNCWVEQKNFDTVRKLVGYAQYSSLEALQVLNELYRVQGLLQNYVLPSQKLLEKKRVGSRVSKHYDKPLTPAQRVLLHPQASAQAKSKIRRTRAELNPLALADEVAALQQRLLGLTDRLSRTELKEDIAP
jgi:hypothetical protein